MRRRFRQNLIKIAQEIREKICTVVAKNGGHLASNLGIIELTIAIHKVFQSPRDKIIFDVSHQCYAHKILTDRDAQFSTLRKTDGISGFTSPEESAHDVFYCGHAGTALSTALGFATARDLQNQNYHIIAILGDAALTNGLTLEALNNIANKKIIIVLNDNGYAIANNVGCIAKYLNSIICSNIYNKTKIKLKCFLRKLPFGTTVIHSLSRLKRRIKSLILPSSFFEYYGLRYIGPIDGHNFEELFDALECSKKERRPVLLHVKTKKGHGNRNVESAPEKHHGVSPYACSGYSKIFGNELCQLAEENKKIVAITAAMASGTGLEAFQKKFPKRFFDVGIAEEHAVAFAAGLSKAGLFPVCAIYSTFLQRAFDQVFHDIALQNLPCLIAIDRAGLCANDGPTHHGLFDIAYLKPLPNLILFQPSDTEELKLMISAAINWNKPCCIRYPRATYVTEIRSHCPIKLGKSEKIQEGSDYCIIALGEKVYTALQVAQVLSPYRGTIINARFIKPYDEEMLEECAQKYRFIYTIEDHVRTGGFGESVACFLEEHNCTGNFHLFAWPDQFLPHASTDHDLEKLCHFTVRNIAKKIRSDLSGVD